MIIRHSTQFIYEIQNTDKIMIRNTHEQIKFRSKHTQTTDDIVRTIYRAIANNTRVSAIQDSDDMA